MQVECIECDNCKHLIPESKAHKEGWIEVVFWDSSGEFETHFCSARCLLTWVRKEYSLIEGPGCFYEQEEP